MHFLGRKQPRNDDPNGRDFPNIGGFVSRPVFPGENRPRNDDPNRPPVIFWPPARHFLASRPSCRPSAHRPSACPPVLPSTHPPARPPSALRPPTRPSRPGPAEPGATRKLPIGHRGRLLLAIRTAQGQDGRGAGRAARATDWVAWWAGGAGGQGGWVKIAVLSFRINDNH